jgi:glycerophosphoryl diester phosphodiesterase
VGALVAYWLATGGLTREGAPAWITARAIAHRGLHDRDGRPENSLAAFGAAAEAGHPIELDVHATADGAVVVIHDDTLERMAGDRRRVDQIDLSELRGLRLAGTDQRIPMLREVLDLVGGRVPVFIEIKNRGKVGRLEGTLVRELNSYAGEIAVISFNPDSLVVMAELDPDIPRGQLSGTFKDEDLESYKKVVLRHLLMNWKSRPHFIAYELGALPYIGVTLQRWRGRPILGWTAEDADDVRRARGLCDQVIADPGALE